MHLKSSLIILSLTSLMLQGCAGPGPNGMNKQSGGALIGSVAGGILGSNFGKGKGSVAMSGVGAVLGALAGSQIGAQMDAQDRQILALKTQNALESGQTGHALGWKNPDNGHSGTITPTRTYQNPTGEYCREYTQQIRIGGKIENAYGKACRRPNGSWEIIQ